MAINTSTALRNQLIYSVYVRNHGPNGTFKDIENDLDRIKSLGTDIIWLMPIHPIGKVNKKGSLGCPYAITDFKGVNPEYGTLEDFISLIELIHLKDMKVIIDVVYNHTAPDALYRNQHPDYYFKNENGDFGNKIADWSDIIDLDYDCKDLWQDQIEVLCYWSELGVDGFRCDVASLVPVDFWMAARSAVNLSNPDTIWLAETVHPHFIEHARRHGVSASSDSEIFQAFDISYDYDTHTEFMAYLKGTTTLESYLEKKRMQEYIYPENYIKLRFLENHDNPRFKSLVLNKEIRQNWTAFSFFEKGPNMIYAGQETDNTHTPSLFDIDKVDWTHIDEAFIHLTKTFSTLKKDPIFIEGHYTIHKTSIEDVIVLSYESDEKILFGIFNVGQKTGTITLESSMMKYGEGLEIPSGHYRNLIDETFFSVNDNRLELSIWPIIFEVIH